MVKCSGVGLVVSRLSRILNLIVDRLGVRCCMMLVWIVKNLFIGLLRLIFNMWCESLVVNVDLVMWLWFYLLVLLLLMNCDLMMMLRLLVCNWLSIVGNSVLLCCMLLLIIVMIGVVVVYIFLI